MCSCYILHACYRVNDTHLMKSSKPVFSKWTTFDILRYRSQGLVKKVCNAPVPDAFWPRNKSSPCVNQKSPEFSSCLDVTMHWHHFHYAQWHQGLWRKGVSGGKGSLEERVLPPKITSMKVCCHAHYQPCNNSSSNRWFSPAWCMQYCLVIRPCMGRGGYGPSQALLGSYNFSILVRKLQTNE